MRESPFIDDPRVLMRGHIARAVASPMEQVRAINIRAAEHQAALAKASGLDMGPAPLPAGGMLKQSKEATGQSTRAWELVITWFSKLFRRC